MLLLAYEGMSRRDYPAKETLQYRWLKVMVHLLHMTQRQPQVRVVPTNVVVVPPSPPCFLCHSIVQNIGEYRNFMICHSF